MESRVIPPDHASARLTEMGETFNQVLFKAADAMEKSGIPYAVIGGIASAGMGRPRSTHDIDIFVRPEDADASLDALASSGFETEKTDKRWLYKAWMDEMMVDVIFKSSGDLYFDGEMQAHAKPIEYHGRTIPAVAPEDLIIIKAAVHSEIGPHHWHDALAVLSHSTVDWDYLLRRARRAPRRILALLIYAQSNDIWIPNSAIMQLSKSVFGEPLVDQNKKAPAKAEKTSESTAKPVSPPASQPVSDVYLIAHVQEALAADPRCGAIDVQLNLAGNRIAIRGEAQSEAHKRCIDAVVREHAQGFHVENLLRISEPAASPAAEEVV
ncbi:MAG TPA: nucleotidyltransferase [Bdellovibrionales bacterium]|nr:nucleotidyltransferase [Bdellovibrionales bacterium]